MNDKKIKLLKRALVALLLLSFFLCLFNFSSADETSDIEVYSPSALLVDSKNEQILYEKNANEKMYPASTTKLMTAILVMENCKLDDKVTVPQEAIDAVPYSYATCSLKAGEVFTVDELLHVLLIPSANDAANTLAIHVSGSIEEFANLMNTEAKNLGANNTNFVNPSGVHDENHYSTAYDMYLIGKKASSYDRIREIVKQTECSLPPLINEDDEENPVEKREFKTTNILLRDDRPYYYEYATGLKTGYTDPAKSCIVATAEKDGRELFCIVLGSDRMEDKSSYRDLDCNTLFEYGFNNFEYRTICKKDELVDKEKLEEIPEIIKNSNLAYSDELSLYINTSHEIQSTVVWQEGLELPIRKGDELGTITYLIDGKEYNIKLLADEYILSRNVLKYVYYTLLLVLVLDFIKILWSFLKNRRKKKSKNDKKEE